MPSVSPSWRESDFRTPERKNPRRWIGRGVGFCTFLTLLLLLNEQRRDGIRCDQDCYGTYRTYEPGHPWTNYTDSWQWDAQNVLMTISFLVSVAASVFLLAGRRRRAVVLTVVSLVLSASFIAWVQLSPPVGSE
jgi:hypothetical protein